MKHERRILEEIGREECLQLLDACMVGRVAVPVEGHGPLVVPVNFAMDGETVVFRSDVGTKVRNLAAGLVSFEADAIDPFTRTGWSVLVEGDAYVATHWETTHVKVTPWVDGAKGQWVRIVPTAITGRRIRLAPEASVGSAS